jgi:hypothetical protein
MGFRLMLMYLLGAVSLVYPLIASIPNLRLDGTLLSVTLSFGYSEMVIIGFSIIPSFLMVLLLYSF